MIDRQSGEPSVHTGVPWTVRFSDGKATQIDVIDSNSIAGSTMGRHVLPWNGDELRYYNVW